MEKDILIIGPGDTGKSIILNDILKDLPNIHPIKLEELPKALKETAKVVATMSLPYHTEILALATRVEEELSRKEVINSCDEILGLGIDSLWVDELERVDKTERLEKHFVDTSDFNVKRNQPKWMKRR